VRGLLPGDPPEWVRDRLLAEHTSIIVVGHMPQLPRLLALMMSGAAEFPQHGMVCAIRVDNAWRETWRAGEPTLLR
jgi:phosphohistidine phosphatase SixA